MDLPIYPQVIEAKAPAAKQEEPASAAVEAVKTVRMGINDGIHEMKKVYGQAEHIIETGKAHTQGDCIIVILVAWISNDLFDF